VSRLEEIAARVAAATPGPWGAWIEGLTHPFHPEITAWGGSSVVYTTTGTAISEEVDRDADAAFIAAARDDVPFLLAEVERLQAALRLHNLTPTGKVRACLPGCIACALLVEKP
jgi:hypothetical protein